MIDKEIPKTIGYITDGKYLASYYGLDVKRETLHERKEKITPITYVNNRNAPAHMNNDYERRWNANSRKGSAQLRDALFEFFAKRQRGENEQ